LRIALSCCLSGLDHAKTDAADALLGLHKTQGAQTSIKLTDSDVANLAMVASVIDQELRTFEIEVLSVGLSASRSTM